MSTDGTEPYFPLSPSADYDYTIGQHWEIGLHSWTPLELRENLTAGIIAFQAGYSSIDYVKRRYGQLVEPFEDNDSPIKATVEKALTHIEAEYRAMRPRTGATLAVVTFDQIVARAMGTLQRGAYLARRGYLFETALVLRGLMEQIAWGWAAGKAQTEDDLFKIHTQRSVTAFKRVYPTYGRLYGELSKFAHFDANLHHWFYAEQEGEIAVRYADNQTKIVSTAWVFPLVDALVTAFESYYNRTISTRLVLTKSGGFRSRRFTVANFRRYYSGLHSGLLRNVESLFPPAPQKDRNSLMRS